MPITTKHKGKHRKCRVPACHLPAHEPHCSGHRHICGRPNPPPNYVDQLFALTPKDIPHFAAIHDVLRIEADLPQEQRDLVHWTRLYNQGAISKRTYLEALDPADYTWSTVGQDHPPD